MNKIKLATRKTLIALIEEMVNAEESSDGEYRAIYANVAKYIVDNEGEYNEQAEDNLRQLIGEAHEHGYRNGYKLNW